jgi:mannosyltransferase OCH1-like enzyme
MEDDVMEISKDLEKLGIFGVLDAYNMLRPRAFKSDFWRWIILWSKGGIYADPKLELD